jgi:hypothetical protein
MVNANMIANQKKLPTAESHTNLGLHLTCIKNSITHDILKNAIRRATRVLAP